MTALGVTVMAILVFAGIVYTGLQNQEIRADQARTLNLLAALAQSVAAIRDGLMSVGQAEDTLREHVSVVRADIATVHMAVLAARPHRRQAAAANVDGEPVSPPGRWTVRETSSVRVIQVPRETETSTSPREPVKE